jgi:hypothetical protein
MFGSAVFIEAIKSVSRESMDYETGENQKRGEAEAERTIAF